MYHRGTSDCVFRTKICPEHPDESTGYQPFLARP
jgi:hypothetical protein